MKKERVGLRLELELLEAVQKLADKRSTSTSSIFRAAVLNYLATVKD